MIGYVNLKTAVISRLKDKVADANVVADDIQSGFKKPAFFVQVVPVSDEVYDEYAEKQVMINIHYFSKELTDLANMKMLDTLSGVFLNILPVNDRVLTVSNKRHQIVDNVLQFKFDLEFTDSIDNNEDFETMQELLINESEVN